MAIEVVLPEIGKTKRSSRDLVISALMFEHPLTLIKITNSIKKKFRGSVTFQGVRKAVNSLIEKEVINKTGKEYSLNKDWILNLRDFASQLQDSYFSNKNKYKDLQAIGEDLKVYTFDNLIDVDQFINILVEKWSKEKPGGIFIHQCGHAYYTVGNLEEESRINDILKKTTTAFYTLCTSNTKLDKWAGKFFKKQGFYYSTFKGRSNQYLGSYNDYFFSYETPKSITKELDEIYSNTKDFESLDFVKLITLLRKSVGIKLTVMRNPMMAEQVRESVMSKFKK